jgi:transposase InsO family protein
MAKPTGRSRLTPFGRLLLVQRVIELNWPVPRAAEAMGVSRATAYKWLERYRSQGLAGLEDRSSRPQRSPGALAPEQVTRILRARQESRLGPHRLAPRLGISRSTIYKVLRRQRLSRLADLDRVTAAPVRYVREFPGELLHLDIKKLGRIPEGGGHAKVAGARSRRRQLPAGGYEYVHVAVDDCSRVALAKVLPDERGPSAASFLLEAAAYFAQLGVRIERVMTDRGWCYTDSKHFQAALAEIGARHKLTRPWRPQTNGKAEAFINTLQREWAYARLYTSNQERLDALPAWLHSYNHDRHHTELRDRPPMTVLVNKVLEKYS